MSADLPRLHAACSHSCPVERPLDEAKFQSIERRTQPRDMVARARQQWPTAAHGLVYSLRRTRARDEVVAWLIQPPCPRRSETRASASALVSWSFTIGSVTRVAESQHSTRSSGDGASDAAVDHEAGTSAWVRNRASRPSVETTQSRGAHVGGQAIPTVSCSPTRAGFFDG